MRSPTDHPIAVPGGSPPARSTLGTVLCISAMLLVAGLVAAGTSSATTTPSSPLASSPIKHVVVIFQENHSFNDLLGRLCVDEGKRCAGTTVGEISDGTKMTLRPEPDIVPGVGHLFNDQIAAMNGGAMNGWDHVDACGARNHYRCMAQAQTGAVPTLWSLADTYAISDRTFETNTAASWGSHIELVAATIDGFQGDPYHNSGATEKGDACLGQSDATWWGDAALQRPIQVPACIPDINGNGPYRASPVHYVPTIMDSMEAAGRSWGIYAPDRQGRAGYGWSICPTFYECISTHQHDHVRQPHDFAVDARAGKLPALSILIPNPSVSQHNGNSLIQGDNWIAENVSAVMSRADQWNSTAILIAYDDCGCFYDGVRPPGGFGIRTAMVIVSPWAKPRYVDHHDASFASILAFTEHVFGLPPLQGGADGNAYDFAKAFDFAQRPLAPIALPPHPVPGSSLRWIAHHPPPGDDPT